ncbi:MAG: Ribosomal silencing factor RsfS [Clostridia bacterium 41_269]|nr:MAG: Ribosomal silencing factor RsfS [Clostridia bacterium 41_269]
MVEAQKAALAAAGAAKDAKAKEVVVLDLRGLSFVTDFFVIGSGDSDIQVQSIADKVMEEMEKIGTKVLRIEGYREARWVLLDYGDVVVHIFHRDIRSFYNLERLWWDAPVLEGSYPLENSEI